MSQKEHEALLRLLDIAAHDTGQSGAWWTSCSPGGTPAAAAEGGGVDIYYVHSDHLNTPRKISRPSDNKLRWTWEPDPFGVGAPNENPESLGAFVYNLRFPGQVF